MDAQNDVVLSQLRKVDQRLDVLVDLSKAVAVLQTQNTHFLDELDGVRQAVRENATRVDLSLTRANERVDELFAVTRSRSETIARELQLALKSNSEEQTKAVTMLANGHSHLEQKVNNSLHWVKGAYAVAGLFAMFVLWAGNRWLDDIEAKVQELLPVKSQVIDLQNRVNNYQLTNDLRNGAEPKK